MSQKPLPPRRQLRGLEGELPYPPGPVLQPSEDAALAGSLEAIRSAMAEMKKQDDAEFAQKVEQHKPPEMPAEEKLEDLSAERYAAFVKTQEQLQQALGAPPATSAPPQAKDDNKAALQIDPADRQEFVQSVLDGHPFGKEFTIFDGRLKVTFTSLSQSCEDWCAAATFRFIKQMDMPYEQGVVTLWNLRLALALDELVTEHGEALDIATARSEWMSKNQPGNAALLPQGLRAQFSILDTGTMWRTLGNAFVRFEALIAALEKEANSENF